MKAYVYFYQFSIHTNQGFNTHINAPAAIRKCALSLIINQSQQIKVFLILNFIYNL